jgi:two-component system chemotaxis response regulator CheY
MDTNGSIEQLCIIVIDDNGFLANITRQALKSAGAQHVYSANNAETAFASLRSNAPRVIILSMAYNSGVSALELIRMIRAGKAGTDPRVPIIAVSDDANRSTVMRARDMGVHAFVPRPFSARQLVAHVVSAARDGRRFIRSKSFIGPDRRGKRTRPFEGTERRKPR